MAKNRRSQITALGVVGCVGLFVAMAAWAGRGGADPPASTRLEARTVVPGEAEPRSRILPRFIENQGQLAEEVRYYTRTDDVVVFVTDRGVTHVLPGTTRGPEGGMQPSVAVRERFVGAGEPRAVGADRAPAVVNSFVGDRSKWRRGVPTFDSVALAGVWPGVGLTIRHTDRGVEKVFVVAPGADPEVIRIAVDGASGVRITGAGALRIESEAGELELSPPLAYQTVGGRSVEVAAAYEIEGDTYGFAVSGRDPSAALVIDPFYAATLIGGGSTEYAIGIGWDSRGNVLVSGSTQSWDFPTTAGAYAGTCTGCPGARDVFVSKLSADLSTLIASTFLGGEDWEIATSMVIDRSDNVYVSGHTQSLSFPTTSGAFQETFGGDISDGFVGKLSADLGELLAATYVGGSGYDGNNPALALVEDGSVFVVGETDSVDFPTTAGAYDRTLAGMDFYVVKLDSSLSAPALAATLLGGTSYEQFRSFTAAVDDVGNVVVTGASTSLDFPTTPGAYDETGPGGGLSTVVAKLSSDLSQLIASTFLGGSGTDYPLGVTVEETAGIVVTGRTEPGVPGYPAFPTTADAYDTTIDDQSVDAYVSRLTSDLSQLTASTVLGGSGSDLGIGVGVDGKGVYVAGETGSPDFPTTLGALDRIFGSAPDGFLARFDLALSALEASTFVGGAGWDRVLGLALAGNVVLLAGDSESADFPTSPGAFDVAVDGPRDGFVLRIHRKLAAKEKICHVKGRGRVMEVNWQAASGHEDHGDCVAEPFAEKGAPCSCED